MPGLIKDMQNLPSIPLRAFLVIKIWVFGVKVVDDELAYFEVAIDHRVHFQIVVVLAERIDERLGYLQPSHVEEKLEKAEAGADAEIDNVS